MAYKFQLGEAKLSGSITQTDGSGDLRATTVDSLDASSGGITNAGAIAGVSTISGSGKFEMGSLAIGGTDVSATAAELNILDGVTSTASELNLLDGAAADTVVNSKAVIYGSAGEVNASAFHISGQEVIDGSGNGAFGNVHGNGTLSLNDGTNTVSSTELLILSGATVTTAELNILDGVTSTASELNILDGVTSTAAELNLLDGAAADTVVNSKAVIYGSAGEVNATSFDISGTEVISSAGNLAVNAIEFDGNIDIANPGAFSLGASMGANTMTLGGSTSTVRIAGDLEVVGTLERVTETELLIEDKAVIVASGSANAAAAAGAGLIVDIASGDMSWLYQANGENVGGVDASSSGDIFVASGSAGLIDIQAAAFYGDGSNLTNVNASGVEETVQDVNSTGTINLNNGLQVLADCSAGDITLTLPSVASLEGKMLKIKRKGGGNAVTLDTASGTIDGASTIILDSDFAAVTIISDGSNFFVI
jgi:hypothetical protein